MHLLVKQQRWVCWLHQGKICQIFSADAKEFVFFFCCCYWFLLWASVTLRWAGALLQCSVCVCSKCRHATFDRSGWGPCNRATSKWCYAKPSEPEYHMQTEGQVPCNGECQWQARSGHPKKSILLILPALRNHSLLQICKTISTTAFCPDNLEKTICSCQKACHDCPPPSGPFALVSPSRVLEPEHVQEGYVQRWVQILLMAASSSLEQQGLSLSETVSVQRDTEMKFCSQWQSHISIVWDQTLSSKMTTIPRTGV